MNRIFRMILIASTITFLGCASTPSVRFEKTERSIFDLPEKRIEIQITQSGFVMNGQSISHEELFQKLKETGGENVYCETDKFASAPIEQVETLASTVIRSGGRFFYRQGRGSIDSILSCYEWGEVGNAG